MGAWLIQKKENKEFVSVCNADFVTLKDPANCLKFADEKSAALFFSFLMAKYKESPEKYELVRR